MKSPWLTQVEALITPVLEAEGFELVLAEHAARAKVLRLYVDHANGVTIDDCAKVSHLVGDLLDAQGLSDGVAGTYNLEVSSPGLDRPLVKPTDFTRYCGRDIRLQSRMPVDGRKKFRGQLVNADEAGLVLSVDGKEWRFAYDDVERARLVPDFDQES